MSGSGARARTRRRRQRASSASRCGRHCGGSVPSWRLCGSRRAASAPLHRCTSAPLHLCTSAPLHRCTSAPRRRYRALVLPGLSPSAPTRTRQVVGLAEEARTGMAHVPRECAAAAALAGRNDAWREAEQAILKRVIAQVCPPTLRPVPPTHPRIRPSSPHIRPLRILPSTHPASIPHPAILPWVHSSTTCLLTYLGLCAGAAREAGQNARRAAVRRSRSRGRRRRRRGGSSSWRRAARCGDGKHSDERLTINTHNCTHAKCSQTQNQRLVLSFSPRIDRRRQPAFFLWRPCS